MDEEKCGEGAVSNEGVRTFDMKGFGTEESFTGQRTEDEIAEEDIEDAAGEE